MAGYTQEALSYVLGNDRTTVARWEAGVQEPEPWMRPKLARVLGVSHEQLADLLTEVVDDRSSRRLQQGSDQVDPIAPPSLTERTVVDTRPGEPGQQDDRERVAAVLNDARRYLDVSVVDYFRRQLDIWMAHDGEHGSSNTLPAVQGLLGAVDLHGRDVKPAVRRDLLSFAACGAEFAGWLYRDAKNPRQARFWYDRATEWAQEAGDLKMQGYILLKRSQMAYETRDSIRVFSLAHAASAGPWQLPARIRAEVAQQLALGMAMCGEPFPVIERKIDEARRLHVEAGSEEQLGQPGGYFTDSTLALRTAAVLTEAGKPARSAELLDEVIATGHDLPRRDAGFFRARRAAALALSGEPDEAALVGLESLELAAATNSRRTIQILADVMGSSLALWRSRPFVRQLSIEVAAAGGQFSG